MAYARFSDESDVYLMLDDAGYFRCVDCERGGPHQFLSTRAAIEHLNAHREAGDRVPQAAFEGLLEDRAENDLWIEDQA